MGRNDLLLALHPLFQVLKGEKMLPPLALLLLLDGHGDGKIYWSSKTPSHVASSISSDTIDNVPIFTTYNTFHGL